MNSDASLVLIPFDIMYKRDWYGWLNDNKVPGQYSMNCNYIIFQERSDELAFRLTFGLTR